MRSMCLYQVEYQKLLIVANTRIEPALTAEGDGQGDHRRIVHLFMTLMDTRPPIHLPHLGPRGTNQDGNGDAAEGND